MENTTSVDNIKKLERFFDYDLKVKKVLNDLVPTYVTFYNDESKIQYIELLLKGIKLIKIYMDKMLTDYKLPNDIIFAFNSKYKELEDILNNGDIYKVLNKGYDYTLKFFNDHLSYMREEFVVSVRKNLKGYILLYGADVVMPETIHEFLHYIHSYVINNNYIYESIPLINSNINHEKGEEIYLRGISSELANNLYDRAIVSDFDSSGMDIISLENKILIMLRDLGHATVVDVDISDMENIYVKYFIPKNTNVYKTSLLKGIYENNLEYATGNFKTSKECLVEDLCSFIKNIPTDFDIGKSYNGEGIKI